MDTKDAYIKQLENTILSLQKQVDNLTEMILLLRKEKFGSSSEKTPKSQIDGQLSLFNEAELEVSSECDEPIVRDVKGYTRKATRTTRAELIKDLPVREIPCDIPEEEMFCDQCGSRLKLMDYHFHQWLSQHTKRGPYPLSRYILWLSLRLCRYRLPWQHHRRIHL